MPVRFFLLKDYIEELDRTQITDSIPVLYPEINNEIFSKLEKRIEEK